MKKLSLGDRMKDYENAYRIKLPKKSYVIIRVDGKAFHTYTKGLEKPFDMPLVSAMNTTALYLARNIMNVKLAYVQSDEISLILSDTNKPNTEAWFDNNIQKMASVSASIATRVFNKTRLNQLGNQNMRWAEFDARVFLIPKDYEVLNYLVWRQQDTIRNSISMVADSLYSHKDLQGLNLSKKKELIKVKGYNWESFPDSLKLGRLVIKRESNPKLEKFYWECEGADFFTADDKELLALLNI